MKRSMDQAEAHKNQIVSELKEKLEFHYARGEFKDSTFCLTMVAAPSWPRGTGIRPRILTEQPNGEKVYEINCGQARRFLEKLGEEPPPKELKK